MTDITHLGPSTALAARAAAIDLSGWQRAFVFYQPRNLCFWLYVMLTGFGVVSFVDMVAGDDSTSVVDAAGVFILYGSIFWLLTQRADRYTELPVKLMIAALLWGAFAATWAMAANANDALGDLYAKELGQRWSLDWSAGLSAPFTEELAKGAGLLLLISLAPRIIRTAFDGFILGLIIGLGFQTLEDMSYALRDAPTMGSTIILRMVTGVSGHFAYTAIFGAGLVYLLGRPAEPRNIRRGLLLMAIAPVLHGLWDSAAVIARGSTPGMLVLWVVIVIVTLLIFGKVFAITVPRERELLYDILAPEVVVTGVLTDAELTAMTGNRKVRRTFRRQQPTKNDRRRARYVVDAAYDLAQELARSKGAETDRVQFARSELARIRHRQPSPW